MVKTYSVNTCDAWLQTAGDDPEDSFVRYEDYAALQEHHLKVAYDLAKQVAGFVKQVAELTDTIAQYNQQNGAAFTEALAQAQITGLAFIRVNANGHVQVLPPDRVRISVIQAVDERTAAAVHQECDHLWFRNPATGALHCTVCREGLTEGRKSK